MDKKEAFLEVGIKMYKAETRGHANNKKSRFSWLSRWQVSEGKSKLHRIVFGRIQAMLVPNECTHNWSQCLCACIQFICKKKQWLENMLVLFFFLCQESFVKVVKTPKPQRIFYQSSYKIRKLFRAKTLAEVFNNI